jgi:hypothetical protein
VKVAKNELYARLYQFVTTLPHGGAYGRSLATAILSSILSLDDIRHLILMHRTMSSLVKAFISDTWRTHPATQSMLPLSPPSQAELKRLFRAFYRWELWVTMFGGGTIDKEYPQRGSGPSFRRPIRRLVKLTEEQEQALFLRQLSAWEREELLCVTEYASRQILKIQNIAEARLLKLNKVDPSDDAGKHALCRRGSDVVSESQNRFLYRGGCE